MSCKIEGSGPEAQAFARALGVDPKDTFKLELNVEAGKIVTAVIHKHVTNTELMAVVDICKEFELHKKEKEDDSKP